MANKRLKVGWASILCYVGKVENKAGLMNFSQIVSPNISYDIYYEESLIG